MTPKLNFHVLVFACALAGQLLRLRPHEKIF